MEEEKMGVKESPGKEKLINEKNIKEKVKIK